MKKTKKQRRAIVKKTIKTLEANSMPVVANLFRKALKGI